MINLQQGTPWLALAASVFLLAACQEDDLLNSVSDYAGDKINSEVVAELAKDGTVTKALLPDQVAAECEQQVLGIFRGFGSTVAGHIDLNDPETSADLQGLLDAASRLAGDDPDSGEGAPSLLDNLTNLEHALSAAPSGDAIDTQVEDVAASLGLGGKTAAGMNAAVRDLINQWETGVPDQLMNGPCAEHFAAYDSVVERLRDGWLEDSQP